MMGEKKRRVMIDGMTNSHVCPIVDPLDYRMVQL
jgi:hypothetical protein